MTFINDTLMYRSPVVINECKLKNTECLAFHSSTTLWRKSCRWWLWHQQFSPAGPITVQWCSFMDCMMAKQAFSWPPVFAQWHGLYTQVTNMAYHCMNHGNNDLCELSTDDWAVHRVILSNDALMDIWHFTEGTPYPIHEASIHPTDWKCTPMILKAG